MGSDEGSGGTPDHTVALVLIVMLFWVAGFLTVVNQQLQVPLKELFGLDFKQATLLTFAFFFGKRPSRPPMLPHPPRPPAPPRPRPWSAPTH